MKILKVIEKCKDCHFKQVFYNNNEDKIYMCHFPELKQPFYLGIVLNQHIDEIFIPENCPLEDYNGTHLSNTTE